MTTKELINKVLRGLRQFALILDSETSTTDDYLLMILQFINEAKEEIEEAGWPWQALRQTVTVTLAASTLEYDLTIAGAADVDSNDRSRLLYENIVDSGTSENFRMRDDALPQVFNVTANEYRLKERPQETIERWHFTDDNQTGQPEYFAIYQDGDSLRIKVYPTPDQAYTLKMRLYIPQAELASTDITTTLSIPDRPVWMKALFKANAERGEELGAPGSQLEVAYLDAHGFAVANEQSPSDETVILGR
jgi:hypothetical protein